MHNQYILTGAMGAGKSTLLTILKEKGFTVVEEAARRILAEQRAINGTAVPEKDPKLFCQLMLSRAIDDYHRHKDSKTPVIYDRGIPDIQIYADLFQLDLPEIQNATALFKYKKAVFFLPSWREIYCTDDERKMTYEQSSSFGDALKKHYEDLGYELHELKRESTEMRVERMVDALIEQGGT